MGVFEGVDFEFVVRFFIETLKRAQNGVLGGFFSPSWVGMHFLGILTLDMNSPCPKTPLTQISSKSEKLFEKVQK